MFADLHIHTNFSDGLENIERIERTARIKNVRVVSITDHDCVEGVKKFRKLETDISLVSGVELTISDNLHVLGYFFDENDKELNLRLKILKAERAKWIIRLVESLKKQYDISVKKLLDGYGEVTLYSVANCLMELSGGTISKRQIYDKYIWNKEETMTCGGFPVFEVDEAINIIKDSKGMPVLAHPSLLFGKSNRIDWILDDLLDKGIQGIEVYHVSNDRSGYINYLKDYAKRRNLFITGGSDFHGLKNKNTMIGEYGLNQEEWKNLVNYFCM